MHLFTGRLAEYATDVAWTGPRCRFVFARAYNSGRWDEGTLGSGWSHTYERRIEERPPYGLVEVDGRGVELLFPADGLGGYGPCIRGGATVSRGVGGGWAVRYASGTVYQYRPDGKLDFIADNNDSKTRLEYDQSGVLVRVVDPVGGALQLEVVDGLIKSVTAKDGQRIQYTYIGRQLAVVTDARGFTTSYTYDPSNGELSSITHSTGIKVEITYCADTDKVTQVRQTSAAGRVTVTRIEYPDAQKRRFIDPLNRVTEYEYDPLGRLLKRVDADGSVLAITRDSEGRILSMQYPDGSMRSWSYGPDGKVILYRSTSGLETRVIRDPVTGYPITLIHPDGSREQREFDARGNLIRQVDTHGQQTLYTVNAAGQVIQVKDSQNRVTEYVYDTDGQLVSTKDAADGMTELARDTLGRVVSTTSPGARVTRTEYEGIGLVRASIDAAGKRTTNEYDGLGRRTAVALPNGARTEFTWDRINGKDVILEEKDPQGYVWKTIHDDAGQIVGQEDPLQRRTTYTLDALGRVVRVDFPDGNFTLMRYVPRRGGCQSCGGTSLLSEIENAQGAVTKFFYDPEGRLVRTEQPDGTAATTEYDSMGRVLSRTRADGGVERLIYSPGGRLTATIDPMGFVTRTEYTPSGMVSRVVDTRDHASSFRFDVLDRLVAATDALGFVRATSYGPDGEILETADANGHVVKTRYDELLRPVEATDPLLHTVKRTYDEVGNCIRVEDENAHAWAFGFNLRGLKTSETDPNNKVTQYS
ncbi:MAG: RHS repeat protein, partial [Candidatus Riflebacteria bacterium]|nr:RHS repeat protein [Candidatus Riflebacteria bacterium]